MKLSVKVVPGASKSEIVGWLGKDLKIRIAAAPERGKANKEVIAILSGLLGVRANQVRIVTGRSATRKTIEVLEIEAAHAAQLINSALDKT